MSSIRSWPSFYLLVTLNSEAFLSALANVTLGKSRELLVAIKERDGRVATDAIRIDVGQRFVTASYVAVDEYPLLTWRLPTDEAVAIVHDFLGARAALSFRMLASSSASASGGSKTSILDTHSET